MRRLTTLIALFATIAALAPAAATANGGDNTAIAVNTKDDSSVFRLAFDIRRVMDNVVDQGNAAVAYASCENCRATAIAIQAVLVGGQVDTVTPTNLAIAINDQCTSCVAMAFAYQFVLGTDGPMHFTPEGNRALRDIRHRLHDLRHTQLSPAELDAELSAIVDELRAVLREELVTAGSHRPDDDAATGPSDEDADGGSGNPSPDQTEDTPEESWPEEGAEPDAGEPSDDTESAPESTEPPPEDESTDPGGSTTTPQEEPTETTP
jgi:putative peptide zinc metalloprotease protein